MDDWHVNPKWGFTHLGGRQGRVSLADPALVHIGGYTLEGLDHIITSAYGHPMAWDLYSIPVPRKPEHVALMEQLLDCSVWANVRKGKIHMLFIYGTTVWGEHFAKFGLRVLNEAKVTKRVSGLLSRRALSMWTSSLRVLEVPWEEEMLLDGAGCISRQLFEEMYTDWHSRVRDDYHDFKIDAMSRRFDEAVMVNLRAFTPQGILKGNFKIREVEDMNGFHLIVPAGAYKAGVLMPEGQFFITAEVQEWHDTVWTDDQTMTNLRPAFTDAFVTEIGADFFAKLRGQVDSGELLGHVGELLNHQVDELTQRGQGFSYSDLSIRWAAAEWVARGLDLRHSESLLRGVAEAKARLILQLNKEGDPVRFKLPIPCAWYMQLISESAARMMGFKSKVTNGEARIWWSAKMVVISDQDYLDHYLRFGGSDADDFFKIFFRTIDGEKSLLVVRSPNGWGEYGVFKYHEGDKYPIWRKANGNKVEFPVIRGALPKPLNAALKDGEVQILELDNPVGDMYTSLPIEREDIRTRIGAEINRTASAGQMVNAIMLWALVMKTHIPMGYGTLETYIDLTTQEDLHPRGAVQLRFLATLLVATVINSGKPIDAKFFEDRGFMTREIRNLIKKGIIAEPHLVTEGKDAFFTIRFNHIQELTNKFTNHAREVANNATPVPGLEELGLLKLGDYGGTTGDPASGMAGLLRTFRRRISSEYAHVRNVGAKRVSDSNWEKLYTDLRDDLTTNGDGGSLPVELYEHNVLSLALACYKFRKGHLYCQVKGCRTRALKRKFTVGKNEWSVCLTHRNKLAESAILELEPARFSDNAVTNRAVFELYVAALEEYGLCAPLGLDHFYAPPAPYDPAEEWAVICKSCGKAHVFVNPVSYQKFRVRQDHCKDCASS